MDVLERFTADYGYRYGEFFAPFDVDNNGQRTVHGDTIKDAFTDYGIQVHQLPMESRVTNGIEHTERFLGQCYLDAKGCEIGIEGLHRYRWQKNETMSSDERPVFKMTAPVKEWEAHLCEAFR